MNRRYPKSLAALVCAGGWLLMAAMASADIYKSGGGGLYAGANYTFLNVQGGNLDVDPGMVSARVGADVTPFFGLEARAGFGVAAEDVGGGVDLGLNSLYGGYATLKLANPSPATPYAIIGVSRYEYDISGPGGDFREEDSGLSLGIGLDMAISDSLAANLEYMHYGEEDEVTLDGLALGLTVRF